MWMQGLIAGFAAGLATALLAPTVARLAARFGAVDRPDGRRHHDGPVPRLGGIALAAGIAAGAGVGALLSRGSAWQRMASAELTALALAVFLVFLLGLIDDLRPVSIGGKFLVQLLAASILVASGWTFPVLELPVVGVVELGLLSPLVALLWLVGITNAINLLDGVDGLASGISAIIASSFVVLAVVQGHPHTILLSAAMAGACLGFLRHNWTPARVFLGDSGSQMLGFLLAALSLYSSLKASAAVAIVVPILALGLPAIDTLLVMLVRFLESPGHPVLGRLGMMFRADRRHLHHLLENLAPRRPRIVLTLYAVSTLFCLMALGVALSRNGALGYALMFVEIAAVVLIRRSARLQTRPQRRLFLSREELRNHLMDVERIVSATPTGWSGGPFGR